MAVPILASLASSALSDIVKSRLKPLTEEKLSQLFNSITGISLDKPKPNELEDLKKSLNEVNIKLNSISNDIHALATVMDERFFGVKQDMMWNSINFINTTWDSYIETLQNHASPPKGKTIATIRLAMIDLIQSAVIELPRHMSNIHHYIAEDDENSLIAQACGVQRNKSKDIITFFAYLKNFVHNYAIIQAKGNALLYIMLLDPEIRIGNAQQVIDRLGPRLDVQDKCLKDNIGRGNYDLIVRILSQGDHSPKITLSAGNDLPLSISRFEPPGQTGYINKFEQHPNSAFKEWKLEATSNLDTISVDGDYTFRVVQNDLYLGWFFPQVGVSDDEAKKDGAGGTPVSEANTIRIMPAENDQVRLLYVKRNGGKDGITYLYKDGGRMAYRGSDDHNMADTGFRMRPTEDYGVGNWLKASAESIMVNDSNEDVLLPGMILVSSNGQYAFQVNASGSPVIQVMDRIDGNKIKWSENKIIPNDDSQIEKMVMQHDGNLVVYNKQNQALWSSRSAGQNGAAATLNDQGILEVWKDGIRRYSSQ